MARVGGEIWRSGLTQKSYVSLGGLSPVKPDPEAAGAQFRLAQIYLCKYGQGGTFQKTLRRYSLVLRRHSYLGSHNCPKAAAFLLHLSVSRKRLENSLGYACRALSPVVRNCLPPWLRMC